MTPLAFWLTSAGSLAAIVILTWGIAWQCGYGRALADMAPLDVPSPRA